MPSQNGEGAPQRDDPPLPLVAHLRELRRRLLYIVGVLGATLLVTWGYSDRVVAFITWPVRPYVAHLQFDTLTDPFFTHFKAAFYAAVFLTFPFTLYQLWRFVAPALFRHEKRMAWPFLLLSLPLFVGGGTFCYAVVYPTALGYLVRFDPTLAPSLRFGDYVSFTLTLMFIFGLVFELPLVSLLLTRMGLLTPAFLTRNRRYALVLIFLAAGVLTPTPDAFTQLLLAGPMLVLYEISVIVCRLAQPRARPAPGEAGA